ncbi:LapA family protein [Gemmobacter fulvus]|uniref:LapA family protein n=1 Tax=Gemmobacter fulvus TaxID=2840474 RepID=UPI0027D96815|nr:lipopolysaccharide assembly protein LapA domain-containing protein [Gemmobacter fulvus]
MLRYLRYLILLVLGLCLLTVALANRAPVLVKALPDDVAAVAGLSWQIEIPLFLAIFGGVAVGLLIGFVWEWIREHRHRAEASTQSAEARRLQRELAAMRDAKGVVQDDVLAILDRKAG